MRAARLLGVLAPLAAALPLAALGGDVTGAAAPEVSPVIYPRAARSLRFSHAGGHRIDCRRCHAQIQRSVAVSDRNLPGEAACRPCHGKETRPDPVVKVGPADRCGTCHLGHRDGAVPARQDSPAANLRFGHRIHLERQIGCAECHKRTESGGMTLPGMATCRACHQRTRAPDRCAVCHLTEKDGRLRTRFAAGRLQPSGSLRGAAHTRGFSRDHRGVARTDRRYCESCHQQRDCLRCHSGTLRPMKIHGGDYATRHAIDARRDDPSCRGCHATQSFCLGCHQRTGVGHETADGAYRPTTGKRFHPTAFVALQRGPGHHAYAARRNLNTCSACHREATCIRCHGSRGRRRGGFSPHGAGFRSSQRCRSLAARNQRVCFKCHAPGDQAIECR